MNRTLLFTLAVCLVSCFKSEQTPEGFEIEEGFTLTRVAKEPLITDPVDLEFNEKGDALVLEMPGYPFEDAQSRLMVLKDLDADGVYDSSFCFVENLGLADSFLPYKKGVLVASPPYLLHVIDADLDYQVDRVDTLMGGFAVGNLQHNFNGLNYGLDNWIYIANGGNDGAPYWWDEPSKPLELRGNDLRINLDTHEMERLGESSGGFELTMNEYGHVFETHNLEHISHLVFKDKYLNGNRILTDHTLDYIPSYHENGLARIYPVGEQESRVNHPEQSGYFSGACGVTYYGGGAFGEEYEHTVWVADVVLNLIHVTKISPNGASFRADRQIQNKEFLASHDRGFRPVNMTVGPDGSMYVLDMHRSVIEHPEWIPDEIEQNLDLNEGKSEGRIYKISKKTKGNVSFQNRFVGEEALLEALKSKNQWMRNTAHRLILEERPNNNIIQGLQNLMNLDNDLAQLHALWLLHHFEKLEIESLLEMLSHPNPYLRENALVIAENYLNQEEPIFEKVLDLVGDENQRVGMQAVLTLSTLKTKEDFYAKNEEAIFSTLLNRTQLANDDWNIAATSIAASPFAERLFETEIQKQKPNVDLLASLALNAESGDLNTMLLAIGNSKLEDTNKGKVTHYLGEIVPQEKKGLFQKTLLSIEPNAQPLFLKELAVIRSKLSLPPSTQFLSLSKDAAEKVLDPKLSDSTRIQYLALLDLLPFPKKAEVLYSCLDNENPLKIQERALRQLSKYREPEIGKRVVDLWNGLSPQTRRYASDLLLYIESNHDALLTGLENGTINIGEMNFDLERRRTLLWWTDNENTKARAKKLFSDSGVNNRSEAIAQMKPALAMNASSKAGRKVFENTCSNCHQYGNLGNAVGPALTEINRKSKETILHEILDPNAAVDPKYINHRVETENGEVHLGIIAQESDESITIQKIGGEKVMLSKRRLKSFRSTGSSLMMEGFENVLSQQEMADLLEFLQKG